MNFSSYAPETSNPVSDMLIFMMSDKGKGKGVTLITRSCLYTLLLHLTSWCGLDLIELIDRY